MEEYKDLTNDVDECKSDQGENKQKQLIKGLKRLAEEMKAWKK